MKERVIFFEITYERKKCFHMIPDITLMKVLNRLEDEDYFYQLKKVYILLMMAVNIQMIN